MRTLQDYLKLDKISNGHYRFMSDDVKAELIARTSACETSSLDERLYWLKNNMTEYPQCKHCGTILTSNSWVPSRTKKAQALGLPPKGYRPFCSRTCAASSNEKQTAIKKTSLEKYGVQHPLQSEQVQAKRKLTNLEKYGNAHPHAWSSPQFKNIIENLHGVANVRSIPGVSDKIQTTKKAQTRALLYSKTQDIEKLFSVTLQSSLDDVDISHIDEAELTWRHECGREFQSNITFRGIRSCPRCSCGTSRGERSIGDWIESNNISVIRRDTSFLGAEVDCLIPDKKVAIEFDGTYWHSARFVSKEKALKKLELAEAAGIQLITIQEHLWEFKRELVISRLSSILNLNQRKLGARKLELKEIEVQTANEFFKVSHLQGGARAKYAYGLFEDSKLVCAASFDKPRFTKKYDWELIRFASSPGVSIAGGAGRLVTTFRIEHKGTLLSYADRCWSQGNLYATLGFKFIRNSDPSYFWVSGKHGIFSRYQTQKKKLPKLLRDLRLPFEEALSEDDNMLVSKFLKVHDRGNSVWVLE